MNNIPVFLIRGKTIPEAWERAVLEVWHKGIEIRTEYDKENASPSRDCTMIIVIDEPMSEPRIHRAFPGGLDDLEVYRQEVLNGVHDHWINPDEGKWTYTYHERLFQYKIEESVIDQINYIISKLGQAPYSRRAQAITWNPKVDPPTDDPPCLQRIWCRLTEEGGRLYLNMNTHWRSRDAYKASFMNIFALTDFQEMMAKRLAEKIKRDVSVGRYVDITDSFHIYGSYHDEFRNFIKNIEARTFEQRTWETRFAEPFFKKGKERLEMEREAGR